MTSLDFRCRPRISRTCSNPSSLPEGSGAKIKEERITLAHGAGGKATHTLIDALFLESFRNPVLEAMEDQATLSVAGARLAFTTDSFVVHPLFFPGGNIGDLAVHDVVIVDNLTPRLEYVEDSATCNRDGRLVEEDNGEGSLILRWELDDPLAGRTGGVVTFKARVR